MIPVYKGKRKGILVVSGGGTKGLAGLGAIKKLMEEKIIVQPDILCGTSAGAMICMLLNIGYHPEEIYYFLLNIDFTSLVTFKLEDLFDDVHFGINSPEPFGYVLKKLMEGKNINSKITFKELKEKTNQTLIITGTCLNTMSLHYFSANDTPDDFVLDAVQISIAMPIIFKPHKYKDKIWIDGGCVNNYPIDLFHTCLDDVIGIYLDDECIEYQKFDDVQTYLLQIFKCIIKGTNITKIEFYKKHTIHIECINGVSTNFEMTSEQKEYLFKQGYDKATQYITNQSNV